MLLFVATCGVYSIDYHPSRKASIISLLNKPLVVIDYFLSLLGSPIVRSPVISAFVGLVIFAIFIFFVVYFGKKIVSSSVASFMSAHSEKQPQVPAILSSIAITERKDIAETYQALPWLSIGFFRFYRLCLLRLGGQNLGQSTRSNRRDIRVIRFCY